MRRAHGAASQDPAPHLEKRDDNALRHFEWPSTLDGLGGFLSNMAFGWIAKAMGFNFSFVGLGVAALCGGALYLFRMPETAERENTEQR